MKAATPNSKSNLFIGNLQTILPKGETINYDAFI